MEAEPIEDPYENQYPKGEPWEAVRLMDVGVPYATSDVAELAGISQRTAYRYLDRFAEAGVIGKRKVGVSVAWYIDPAKESKIDSLMPDGTPGSGGSADTARS